MHPTVRKKNYANNYANRLNSLKDTDLAKSGSNSLKTTEISVFESEFPYKNLKYRTRPLFYAALSAIPLIELD